ncbi:hypothetical protein V6N13_110202 [Hibiscus sabdariffa]|uniref:Uncharacterized protein n=2 Tax=Hibiscus sabdariffa TaxID=183260 RepID=A0ABR2AWQ6_9ROSI
MPYLKEEGKDKVEWKVRVLLLQAHPTRNPAHSDSPAIKALLKLEAESDFVLSKDPHLSTLSRYVADLKPFMKPLKRLVVMASGAS